MEEEPERGTTDQAASISEGKVQTSQPAGDISDGNLAQLGEPQLAKQAQHHSQSSLQDLTMGASQGQSARGRQAQVDEVAAERQQRDSEELAGQEQEQGAGGTVGSTEAAEAPIITLAEGPARPRRPFGQGPDASRRGPWGGQQGFGQQQQQQQAFAEQALAQDLGPIAVFPSQARDGMQTRMPRLRAEFPEEKNEFWNLVQGGIYDLNLESVLPDQQLWRALEADPRDFFNYDMDEKGWRAYQQKVTEYRISQRYDRNIETMRQIGSIVAQLDPNLPPLVLETLVHATPFELASSVCTPSRAIPPREGRSQLPPHVLVLTSKLAVLGPGACMDYALPTNRKVQQWETQVDLSRGLGWTFDQLDKFYYYPYGIPPPTPPPTPSPTPTTRPASPPTTPRGSQPPLTPPPEPATPKNEATPDKGIDSNVDNVNSGILHAAESNPLGTNLEELPPELRNLRSEDLPTEGVLQDASITDILPPWMRGEGEGGDGDEAAQSVDGGASAEGNRAKGLAKIEAILPPFMRGLAGAANQEDASGGEAAENGEGGTQVRPGVPLPPFSLEAAKRQKLE